MRYEIYDESTDWSEMKIAIILTSLFTGIMMASNVFAGERIALEAEPAEKLKACDMYGPGFVYIPGTETCVKISGSIRTTFTVPVGK